jgi:hypothetical protein
MEHEKQSRNWSVISIIAAAWLWFLAALPFFTDAACDFFVFFVLGFAGVLIGISWLTLTSALPRLRRPPTLWWWLSVPMVGILACVLLASDWPFALRVALSERALQRHVDAFPRDTPPDRVPRWVGLLHVNETEESDGAVFIYTSTSYLNRHGVAHIPPGSNPMLKIVRRQHLYGDWYKFEWKF